MSQTPWSRKSAKPVNATTPNQVLVNGICEDYARHVSRAQHVCVKWNEGFCIEYYWTLKPRALTFGVRAGAVGFGRRSFLFG